MNRLIRLALPAVLFPFAIASAQDVTIGTSGSSSGVAVEKSAFDGWAQAWGQTFRAPDANTLRLDSWSFWTNPLVPGQHNTPLLQLVVVEWPTTCEACGIQPVTFSSPIYTSDIFALSLTSGRLDFEVDRILDPNTTYLAFLRAAGVVENVGVGVASFYYGAGSQNSYDDGSLVWLRADYANGVYTDNMPASAAVMTYGGYDARFEATFSPAGDVTVTPEPATMTLLASGLAAIGAAARRRRQKLQS